jgi:assimilatory nitrate reductase catalytic subunit
VVSRRGSLVMRARASDDMRPGDAFVAMHWGARFIGGAGINALTLPAIDPYSKQPELKHAAVRIERFAVRWSGSFAAQARPDLQRAASRWLARFDYAALGLVQGPEILLRLDLANAEDPDPAALAALEELFGCKADDSVQGPDRSVCACFKVVESELRSAIAAGATLAKLQKDLKCGTNCGSCVPELRRLLNAA